ncbi:MAG: CD225/dispanin family protein [Acidimicrobiia bacterium]
MSSTTDGPVVNYCTDCGETLSRGARFCAACGTAVSSGDERPVRPLSKTHLDPPSRDIPDNTTFAVVSLFLFLPTGILALVHANNANNARRDGDYSRARMEAEEAKRWCRMSVWISVISIVFVIIVIGAALGSMSADRDDRIDVPTTQNNDSFDGLNRVQRDNICSAWPPENRHVCENAPIF